MRGKTFLRNQLLDPLYDPLWDMAQDGIEVVPDLVFMLEQGVSLEHASAVRGVWCTKKRGWYWDWGMLHDHMAEKYGLKVGARYRNQYRVVPSIEWDAKPSYGDFCDSLAELVDDTAVELDDHINIEWPGGRASCVREALEMWGVPSGKAQPSGSG